MQRKLPFLPNAAFFEPHGANRTDVEEVAEAYLSRLMDWLCDAHDRRAWPDAADHGGAAVNVVAQPPTEALDLLSELETLVLKSMNPASAGWIAHMDPMPAVVGWLGEMVSAALNNNMLSLEMAPALSSLETELCEAMAGCFGLPDTAGGVMTGGGSLANLQALTLARNKAFPDVAEHGAAAYAGANPIIFASEGAHTSLEKAAMILGLGRAAIRRLVCNPSGTMDAAALSHAIHHARQAGERPICLVATAGTTVTGAIDPLASLISIAKTEGLWAHVDAAWAGAMIFSQHTGRLGGIADADSITFNPQKWCYVPKTSAMVLVRDKSDLHQHFRIPAPYMAESTQTNLGEISVQGTRHADVLKTWLVMRHLGLTGLGRLVDQGIARAEQLVAGLRPSPDTEISGFGESGIVCFRAKSENAEVTASRLSERLGIVMSCPFWRGKRWLRAVLAHPYLVTEQVDHLISIYQSKLV